MKKQPEYGKFPAKALEEVSVKGVKRNVHPNTAILLRFKGLTDDSGSEKKVTAKTEKAPRKSAKTRKKDA